MVTHSRLGDDEGGSCGIGLDLPPQIGDVYFGGARQWGVRTYGQALYALLTHPAGILTPILAVDFYIRSGDALERF